MPSSKVEQIEGLGFIRITKKRGVKRVTMRLHSSGEIRITLPYYLPFSAGVTFAKSHHEWIKSQSSKTHTLDLQENQTIGKNFKLQYQEGEALRSRINGTIIIVYIPDDLHQNSLPVQAEAKKAIKRALIKDAADVLPDRVHQLAQQFNYTYNDVHTKPMKSRWGSCSSTKKITLNCYIMMMPWPIIDYVIMHELSHTKYMNHSDDFWREVSKSSFNYKDLKKQLKHIQPSIHALYV